MTTTTTIRTLHVETPAMPRGARIGAALFIRAMGWLVEKAPARNPASSTATRAQESAHVRELAYRMQNTDPGFAADLFAAAARHESRDD